MKGEKLGEVSYWCPHEIHRSTLTPWSSFERVRVIVTLIGGWDTWRGQLFEHPSFAIEKLCFISEVMGGGASKRNQNLLKTVQWSLSCKERVICMKYFAVFGHEIAREKRNSFLWPISVSLVHFTTFHGMFVYTLWSNSDLIFVVLNGINHYTTP